ncbi:glycosyltransferase family 2 protein [Lutimaribacter sp. EGI FJ00015]|uniref:Glycosyltransferase family 2 protein n=1 Tax=Lutimaribacter degradans TaxID=2945989 RepID=A0ACC6A119_9RHOB|nr:glycosyltransferase family 2 protein [Lutimaribacter sp. EGI FJ00013]MCM2563454.1 glycosyltransferase family 2 protein [Lutimaribacter sp. EGI FJ00013]MCO0614634.1 glycosyltransferase family 2 protein [Lutimaribacter sp. EGI FJ00015]MCO0637305.1 glycosyltransferase family 2 protein [Lutimaribacter sp. EGI FJ00014]
MSPRTALAACMRNEGIFVLEWLAHHAGFGFDRIVVVTNDCKDGSDALLDRAEEMGLVTHIRQDVPSGRAPQDAGMDHVLRLCRDDGVTHVLHIDSDEFLLLDGDLADLHARTEGADVVPIPWRMFGDNGVANWQPGDLVTERNTRAEPADEPGVTKFKCLFRVASFAAATDHNPVRPLVDDPQVRSPDGAALSNASLYQDKSSRFRPHDLACAATTARLNHYAVRSEDLFLMKNDRGDGQGKTGETKYHLGSNWHRVANRNDRRDTSMARHLPAIRTRLAHWRADPALAALERACQDWLAARRDAILTPETRAAWTRRKALR